MKHPTERGTPEARIDSLESELGRVRAEFATFSGRLSHDMQGIFRNIEGFASAVREQGGGRLTEKEAHYLQRIQAGARRGDSLMRDLASLSAASVAELRAYPVDLAGLVDQCIQDLAPGLSGRAVDWERAGTPWPRVMADPALLRLALDHLLGNALKFTRGRAPARIRIDVAATPEEWVLTVADNGAGFDAAYVDRLFKAFERLHLPTEFEGNGVGLALVKMVVERHGGRVRAEAPAAGGAVITITLRRQSLEAVAAGPVREASAAAGGGGRKLRILVVDDDALVLTTLRLMLERDGHQVVAAAGGAAALATLEQQGARFDLVIADWLMPQVGGAEVVQAVKAAQPFTPVIVLTGQRPDMLGQHDVPAAVDQVLDKPITPAKLRSAVAAVAGR
ncbi:MAG: two-component system sensor histidine kinase/response regulator [Ramlibacter sp.]|nr:two-component system sensor histidine kinase/response regulator [Ramlibacter sp.]